MSNLFKGNIAIGGHITPTSPQDTFFVTTEEFHRGGYRTVDSIASANSIPTPHRVAGMKIYVRDEDKEYRCSPDLQSWVEVSGPSSNGEVNSAEISNLSNKIDELESTHTRDVNEVNVKIEELKNKKINIDDLSLEYKDVVIQPGDGPDGQPLPPITVTNVLHVKKATSRNIGIVQPDNKTIIVDDKGIITSKSNKGDGVTIINNNDANNTMSLSPDLVNKIEEIFNNLPLAPVDPDAGGVGPLALPTATSFSLGMVQPDNKTILVDNKGKISAIIDIGVATIDNNGLGKPDNVTIGITTDGSYHVIDPVRRISDLSDVDVNGMSYKQGYFLSVDDTGTKFILKQSNSASNRSTTTIVDNSDYQMVYDLSKHANTAIHLRIEAVGTDPTNPLMLKYVSRTGGEVEERVDAVLQRCIPERDFGIQIHAKGKGKIIFDLLTLK